MTITFIVKYFDVRPNIRYVLGIFPVDDSKMVQVTTEYKLKQEFKTLDEAIAAEKSVTKMLEDFYGPRLVSVWAYDFGECPEVIEFKPLGAKA